MDGSLKSSHFRKNFLLVGLFFAFIFAMAAPSQAFLMNVNVTDQIRNLSYYTVTAPVNTSVNASNITFVQPEIRLNFTANASDSVGTATNYNYSFFVDGNVVNGLQGLISNNTAIYVNLTTPLTNGSHTVLIRFNSTNDGNAIYNVTLQFFVDDTAPVINTSAGTGATTNATNFTDSTPELSFNITDIVQTSQINVSVYVANLGGSFIYDGSTATTNNTIGKYNLSARANGTFIVRFEANDTARNLRNASLLTINVDDTPSIFQPFNPGNGTTTNATNTTDTTPEIAVNLTDNAQTDRINVSVYVDTVYDGSFLVTNNTIGRFNISARRNDTVRVRFESNDSAGNLANASLLTLYVYDGKPTVNIISLPSGVATLNASNSTNTTQIIIFNLTRTGNYTNTNFLNYTIFIDGTQNGSSVLVNNDTNITAVVTGFRNGTHSFWIEGIDPAGNRANSTIYTITTDAEAPYITISAPLNNTNTTDLTPDFQFTIIDNSSAFLNVLNYTIWVDGAVNGQTGLVTNNTLVNVSLRVLSNVTHNITIQVGDFLNNTRNITTWKVSTDAIAPVLSISNSPTTIYQGNVVTISCTISENLLNVISALTVTKPNNQITTLSGCGAEFGDTTAIGTYTITLTANDTAGNGATGTKTFIVSDSGGSSSSSSGGGGGSSAAVSTPSTTVSKTLIVDTFVPDKPNVIKLASENIGFKEISIDIANKVNAVEIKVVKTDSAPAEVTKAVEGKVYQYIEIKHDKLKDENIKGAKVKFTVTKKWASDNGVAKDNVVLKRFKEGSWTDMKTTLSSESSAEITYEAELPGLSVFAIGEAVPTAATQQPAEQPSQQTEQQPAQETTPSTPSAPEQPSAQQPTVTYSNETMYYVAGGAILLLIIAYFWVKASKIGMAKKISKAKKK